MKKRMIVVAVMLLLVFCLSGCGQKESDPVEENSEPSVTKKMELVKKGLTESERTTIGMAGINIRNSTGVLYFNAGENVKNVEMKIVDYTDKTGKWEKVSAVAPFQTDSDGKLLVLYKGDGTRARMALSHEERGFSFSEAKAMPAFPVEKISTSSSVKKPVPIVLNKEIALHMNVEGKQGLEPVEAPDLTAYPDTGGYRNYQRVRAVVVTFSDKEM